MDKFLKIPNFQKGHAAFKEFMKSKYNVDIDTIRDIDSRKKLFEVMKDVKESMKNSTIKYDVDELNNIALNKLQDFYKEKYALVPQSNKLNVEALHRDSSVFGNREVISNPLMPESSGVKSEGTLPFDRFLSERSKITEDKNAPAIKTLPEESKDDPLSQTDFDRLINAYKNDASAKLEESIALQLPKIPENPKSIFEKPSQIQEKNDATESYQISQHATFERTEDDILDDKPIIPQVNPQNSVIVKRYIVINGFDRDWITQKKRYNWRLNFNDMQYSYRNIKSIKMNKLIIPIENNQTKNKAMIFHNRDYKLNYQYVGIKVDEFQDLYDGFNNNSRNTFTCFVFDAAYTAPNGRGYIIMRPAQDEEMVYRQHLSAITSFTPSFCKPSGSLISEINDGYTIQKIEFENYNQLYLKVVLNKYFEKSEFDVGDSVQIKGFLIYNAISSPSYIAFNEFINKVAGHEIVQMGDANDQGFFKNFYIPAPTIFNDDTGALSQNQPLIDALRDFNIAQGSGGGHILNMSLQPVLYIELGIQMGTTSVSQFN